MDKEEIKELMTKLEAFLDECSMLNKTSDELLLEATGYINILYDILNNIDEYASLNDTLTYEEAAKYLRITKASLSHYVMTDRIKAMGESRNRYFLKSELDRYKSEVKQRTRKEF